MQQWWLTKEISNCARQVIESRERTVRVGKSADYGTDLLGLMMNANKEQGEKGQKNIDMTTDEIIAECRTFYTAGEATTTILLTWTMILLGMHQDWQEQARKEVLEVCGKNDFPNADTVNGLKIVRIKTINPTQISFVFLMVYNMFSFHNILFTYLKCWDG